MQDSKARLNDNERLRTHISSGHIKLNKACDRQQVFMMQIHQGYAHDNQAKPSPIASLSV